MILPEWVKWLLGIGFCILVYTSVCAYLDYRRHQKDK